MKTSNQQPPNWPELVKRYNADWERTAVTYGDTVYSKYTLPEDLLVHEAVHVKQQTEYEGGAAAWWVRYNSDAAFRLDQEVEAYRKQVRWIRRNVKDGNERTRRLHKLAYDLANRYGLVGISTAFAARMIGAIGV